jgi:leucyl aminopeptidase (aminopeptidase T)
MSTTEEAAETIINTCMAVQPKEKVLILTDFALAKIGDIILREARKITDADMIEIAVGEQHGEEPSADVAYEMKNYDVIIIPTMKSLSHTKARRDANKAGARIATLPGVTEEMMQRCINIDYLGLEKTNERIKQAFKDSKKIRVTTELGTDVTTEVVNTRGDIGLYHNKGDFGNLPAGEVDSGVRDSITNGKIIVDASFGGIGRLENPITLSVEDGYAVKIEGWQSEALNAILNAVGRDAYKIAEFGIGTNPLAAVTGNILEDEKVLGTVHFALGNDLSYGGKNDVPIHLDAIIREPTIYIDGKKIMEKGLLLI